MQYDDNNKGAIWGNDRKEKPTQPDFKGSIKVDGKEFWLSAWKRGPDANPNAPALKLSVTPKDDATLRNQQITGQSSGYPDQWQKNQKPVSQPQPTPNVDDEIPF